MADPFEVRMRFTNQLRQLNASVTSAQKAAQYAIKYRDMAEDLHSCILEQLERNNMNTRANIMYFIEHFLELANKDDYDDYVRMMQRDIIRVVDAVAPDDGSGAANVQVVRKVLNALQNKSLLEAQAVTQIDEVLKERDASAQDLAMSSPLPNGTDNLSDMPPARTLPPYNNHHNTNNSSSRRGQGGNSATPGLDKKQIEQRMEEDRERHKRQRENIWAVPPGEDAEMERLWEETSDLGEDDHRLGEEEWLEWQAEFEARKCVHQRGEGADGGR